MEFLFCRAFCINPMTEYAKDCRDGHYVVTIGYDSENVYFEDPAMMERGVGVHEHVRVMGR